MSARSDDGEEGSSDRDHEGSPGGPFARDPAATIAHYRKMYDRSSALARIGVWECDLATEALTWTDGVYDLFELPRGSPLRRAEILEMYHEESRRELEQTRAAAIAAGGCFGLDIRIRTARGNDRWLHLTADVEQEQGRSVRIFGTKQDITEARAAQERVQALQAELIQVSRKSAMGAMAATLAHELNQPLAAISNYVAGTRRALDEADLEKDVLIHGLEAIRESAHRAGGIIRSLRQLVDGSAVVRQRLDPDPLIREAATLALATAPDGIEVEFQLARGLVLPIDPIQFQQVMVNLIRNAADAVTHSRRRRILVASAVKAGSAEFQVEDSGGGIATEHLPTLFETFTSTKPGGLGIGLAISRTIVEAHGGTLRAENRAGGGAVFRVALPLAPSSVVEFAAPSARRNGGLGQSGSRALGKPPHAKS